MTSREKQIAGFDPNGVGRKGSLFGLPFTPESAQVVIIPVPWDVTVSYGCGTSRGPAAVLGASPQIDYGLADCPGAWKLGFAMEEIPSNWKARNDRLRKKVEPYIQWLEEGNSLAALPDKYRGLPGEVDSASEELRGWLRDKADSYLASGRTVGVLGGDHSSPLGLLDAIAKYHSSFGILQIDAHADLRDAYEGFRYSHASIMRNALRLPQVSKLVQVGIRDICEEEENLIHASGDRVACLYDQEIKEALFEGRTWKETCRQIVSRLPGKVYLSFDIDGLDPKLCPHTGTPVPGGLELEQVLYLCKMVVLSGREIIGFDLCEVAPGEDEWDGNVGARVLYRLCAFAAGEWTE